MSVNIDVLNHAEALKQWPEIRALLLASFPTNDDDDDDNDDNNSSSIDRYCGFFDARECLWFVARRDDASNNELLAVAMGFASGGQRMYVSNLAVRVDWRGRRLASLLLRAVQAQALRSNTATICGTIDLAPAATDAGFASARLLALYRHLGASIDDSASQSNVAPTCARLQRQVDVDELRAALVSLLCVADAATVEQLIASSQWRGVAVRSTTTRTVWPETTLSIAAVTAAALLVVTLALWRTRSLNQRS